MGGGYFRQQMTQPQTLGYSFADSPAGLLGWIYEELMVQMNAYAWDYEVLTWISIYWFSRGGPTVSLSIYFEVDIHEAFPTSELRPIILLGLSRFPKDT
ncbi:Epoxide hydrolase [Mycena venus]|uniref:Epoxide hydrolase n=1 Tax=Mycena venus TaxID=2733690 RepID=A0A8H6Y2D7_9AGAR|nr:Epoxide hydrolase [Mycena venus]